ncbi:MAG TPA: hypothetical protein VK400_16825 [Pyrinomonadaceae bacterium]|nr:hypothetical protein [Pyrinomonadaceae bacterium]
MNRKKVGVLIAMFQIVIAIWYFDWNSTSQMIISTALFLSGLSVLLIDAESKPMQKAGSYLLYIGGIIGFLLIFKSLFIG